MIEPFVLAIDAGSSSVRAALYDGAATLVPGTLCQIEIEFARAAGGVAQLDAAQARQAVERAIDGALAAETGMDRSIAVVAMTTFWHSCVALGEHGEALSPVLTWADTRSEQDAQRLRTLLDGAAVLQRTGCPLHPSYLPAKIAWLQWHQPELFKRTRALVSFAQYCTGVWLGTTAASVSMASGSGLFNDAHDNWDDVLLAALHVPGDMLGELAVGSEMLPAVRAAYRQRWPRLARTPWRAPIGDGAASNVGAGCHTADRLALMVGTSGALRRCERAAAGTHVPPGLWRYRLDRQYTVTGGALSDAGNAHAWLRATLRLPNEEECEAALAQRQPAQHGLTVLPFWSGERSMGWAGDATAMIAGMKLHSAPLDIYQAVLEGVSYRFGAIFDAFGSAGDTVVATGGGLRSSPAWLQMMADVLGTRVVASAVSESSLRGAVIVALRDSGLTNADTMPSAPLGDAFEPRWDYHAVHRDAWNRQEQLYEREVGPEGHRLLARQTR